ncbi:hypothetical protein RFM68_20810 [Mesorhizobium sp. MSK_1335]|uniref:Uncharacterized protein n=1 Tax=Mesorhizobium montanum TaxID=3072323 RepID=A0ABU4ZRC4_9HYPH|nr:hypothetical protein [Mesorhizobium sp. MSK_1335]MDX8526947.1 hypothetical protein [Mesorhizobium sp. MSK_1335]
MPQDGPERRGNSACASHNRRIVAFDDGALEPVERVQRRKQVAGRLASEMRRAPERFTETVKRSISLFLRNSGRKTVSHFFLELL